MPDHSTASHFEDVGWALVPGLLNPTIAAELHGTLSREIGTYSGPLLRVLSSQHEPHTRDGDGRITNPVIYPGQLPVSQFPDTHGLEQRLLSTTDLMSYATRFLGAPVALLQSGWWPSSIGTPWHRDSHPIAPGAPLLGVWLALEDIERQSGAFVVHDRSHLPQQDPELAQALADSQALYQRQFVDKQPLSAHQIHHTHRALAQGLTRHGCTPTVFTIRAGTAVFWNGNTVHGSETPATGGGTRSSLLFHFVRSQDVPATRLSSTTG